MAFHHILKNSLKSVKTAESKLSEGFTAGSLSVIAAFKPLGIFGEIFKLSLCLALKLSEITFSDIVYLLVVEEDKSLFSFKDRFEMVRRGVADLANVVVLSGGRYAVSSLTFPSYFTKEENLAKAHTAIDAEIFCRHIAPALGVTRRFVGTEPLSAVTAVYNETLKGRLPRAGIEVTELVRLEKDGAPVSASRVRALLGESLKRPSAEVLTELAKLLPPSSLDYMMAEVFHD